MYVTFSVFYGALALFRAVAAASSVRLCHPKLYDRHWQTFLRRPHLRLHHPALSTAHAPSSLAAGTFRHLAQHARQRHPHRPALPVHPAPPPQRTATKGRMTTNGNVATPMEWQRCRFFITPSDAQQQNRAVARNRVQ